MGKLFSKLLVLTLVLGFSIAAQAQETAASLYNDGLAKLKAKDYEAALPLLEKALEIADPEADAQVIKLAKRNGAIATYQVGANLRKADQYDEAIAMYEKGMEFSPGFYANFLGKAQALEAKGDRAAAVTAYLKAGQLREGSAADKAEQYFRKAENMSALAYADKNWDETIACAEAYLASKESADTHYYLAFALKEKGANEKAIEHADKGLTLVAEDEDTGKFHMLKAETFESTGQKDKAVESYGAVPGDSKYAERAQYKVNELSGGR